MRVERYRCHHRDCPVRAECTRDPKGRQIEVRPHTAVVQAMRAALQEPLTRAQWRERSTIIEPRLGQIKQHDGFRRWTVWGLAGVKTQWSLRWATLNLRILYARWRARRPPGTVNAAVQTQTQAKRSQRIVRFLNRIVQAWEDLLAPKVAEGCPQPYYLPEPEALHV